MSNQKFEFSEYVEQMSKLMNLDINPEYKDGVIENFDIIKNIAEIVNNFPLPEEIEIAPVFEP